MAGLAEGASGRRGKAPAPAVMSGWQVDARLRSRALLLTSRQVWTLFPFFQCMGSGPQGQLKERNAWHTRGLERKNGGWGQWLFPSSFQTFFSFLPGLRVPFQQ